MPFYNKNLLSDLVCPHCKDYMHPPIKQCLLGHSFCDKCFSSLKRCKICRQLKSPNARSFILERLHDKIFFACRHRENGCPEMMLGSHIEKHEAACSFSRRVCPLKSLTNCPWRGATSDVLHHCEETHPDNLYRSYRHKLTCKNFTETSYSTKVHTYYNIIAVYDNLFKLAWEVNFETGFMRWCVFLLGLKPLKFNYEIEIYNLNVRGEKIVLRGRCPLLRNEADIFNNKNCLISHYDMMKTYCKHKKFTYMVTIYNVRY